MQSSDGQVKPVDPTETKHLICHQKHSNWLDYQLAHVPQEMYKILQKAPRCRKQGQDEKIDKLFRGYNFSFEL